MKMKKHVPQRMVIYTKDVQSITGRKYNAARRLLLDIRQRLGKEEGAFVTIAEFCACTGLPEEQVTSFLHN